MKLVLGFLLVVGLAGLVVAAEGKKVVRVQFRLGEQTLGPGLTEMTVSGSKQKVYLHEKVELSEADVAQASAEKTETGVKVDLTFSEAGKEKLAKLTQENKGKFLCILVDGKLIMAPKMLSVIPAGKAALTGSFSLEEANRIVKTILGKRDAAGGH